MVASKTQLWRIVGEESEKVPGGTETMPEDTTLVSPDFLNTFE
jgi:hypothetical protein